MDWEKDGLVILRDFVPHNLIDAYAQARGTVPVRWDFPTPYMHEKTILDLCCWKPLTDQLTALLGEEPLLHLNLTAFVSTQRAWHQDAYLNADEVGDYYAAAWMALDDIDPRSGPFEFVRGSHRWPDRLSRDDAMAMATDEERAHPEWYIKWPNWTEGKVGAYWQEQIDSRQSEIERFIPATKGDVLIWSPWLVHRGSVPEVQGMERRSLISHFSGVNHRSDMQERSRHEDGGQFAVIHTAQLVQ